MKVVHVLTLVTPDGAYGGPYRVALNQIQELRARGHDARLVAGATGFATLPTHIAGVPVHLFPAIKVGPGFSGWVAPAMLPWLLRHATDADVAHVHLARELVVLGAAEILQRRGVPWVAQTHGMIVPSTSPLAPALDALATRRLLRHAAAVLYLNDRERDGLRAVEPRTSELRRLPNGVPLPEVTADPGSGPPDVLFLARLAPRKRPAHFVRAAQALAARHPTATFSLVGPDEGEGSTVVALLGEDDAGGRIRWEGPLSPEATGERMRRAAVHVLPAIEEPYGMSVLEAMAAGVPSVVVEDCGLAPFVRGADNPVVGRDVGDLVAALDPLLASPSVRREAGARARAAVAAEQSMTPVVDDLLRTYDAATGAKR